MKKGILFLCFLGVLAMSFFTFPGKKEEGQYVVGVILPMEHEALSQITRGIQKELEEQMGRSVTVKVKNAQGDPGLQKAFIEQLAREECDLLIPVGTATSQMALQTVPERKILCLAADSSLLEDKKKTLQATGLSDELSAAESLSFFHRAFPEVRKITLLYSASEKVAKEVPLACQAAQHLGIEVQKLMVQTMGELYIVSRSISPDSQAIFILKDHLIVSGIQTVVQQAQARQIPIMTSDEGSVLGGASFAIGVPEASIGERGAVLAKAILEGTPPESIPPQKMGAPFPLFINRAACEKMGVNTEALCEKARSEEMPVFFVGA